MYSLAYGHPALGLALPLYCVSRRELRVVEFVSFRFVDALVACDAVSSDVAMREPKIHTYIHTNIHTYIHTYTYIYIHIYATYTHAQAHFVMQLLEQNHAPAC